MKKRLVKNTGAFLRKLLIISCLCSTIAVGLVSCAPKGEPLVPVTPAWALGHIVWEDEFNTRDSLLGLVRQYQEHNIPVDGVIIDSPWSTAYNDFIWDTRLYPEPHDMLSELDRQGVHSLLWLTGMVNTVSNDCPVDKSANFDEAVAKGYTVNGGEVFEWWKGRGAHIDFTNPEAVQWWYGQLDRIMTGGVYGFKVDQGEIGLPDSVRTHIGTISQREFRHYYYDAMYDYVVSRRPGTGAIVARPYSFQGDGDCASRGKLSVGWCGDFTGEWSGLRHQIQNVYRSARDGYGAVGVEIGGYFGTPPGKEELIRYTQFAALTASMINGGGHGPFENHLAWWHGPDAEKAYREAVSLHKMLVPYFFSTLVDCGKGGEPLLRQVNLQEESHLLGNDLFTKAITCEGGTVQFTLPREGRWVDWRTREIFEPGTVISRTYGLDEFPLFVREGSIIPVMDDGCLTLLITPGPTAVQARFHLPLGEDTSFTDCRVSFDPVKGRINIKADTSGSWRIILNGVDSAGRISGCTESRYDPGTRQLSIGVRGRNVSVKCKSLKMNVL